jgi:hypothetical protein
MSGETVVKHQKKRKQQKFLVPKLHVMEAKLQVFLTFGRDRVLSVMCTETILFLLVAGSNIIYPNPAARTLSDASHQSTGDNKHLNLTQPDLPTPQPGTPCC